MTDYTNPEKHTASREYRAAARTRTLEASLAWALEQLRMWWQGVPRDTGDPAAALAELDRMEAVLLHPEEEGK